MKVKAFNIVWDTKEDPEVFLPSSVILDVEEEEQLADKLSDKYGFCVCSFESRKMKERPNLLKICAAISNAMAASFDEGYEITLPKITDLIDDQDRLYCDSVWHVGEILSFRKENITICIKAVGDVCARIYEKETCKELCNIKDKANAGLFREMTTPFFKGDEELYNMENFYDNTKPCIEFSSNNWFEMCVFFDDALLAREVLESDICEIMNDSLSIIDWAEEMLEERSREL